MLKERINADLKDAMRAKDQLRLSVIRMLLSELKYAQAAVNIHAELPEAEVQKIIASYLKRLSKSLEDFPEGEKREAIRNEMRIVEEYLPKKAGPEEIAQAITSALGETADRNFGVIMKAVMAKIGAGADGKLISQMIKDKLAGS